MKLFFTAVLALVLLNAPAHAQSSGIFDLGNNSLACVFVEEAEEIANVEENARITCGTRSVTRFNEMRLLREAYRADPEATLDLIERILKAGKGS